MLETSVQRVYVPSQPITEGGMESFEYSPEDLALYDKLKAEQVELYQQDRLINKETGNFYPEWLQNWHAFEAVRNKYNGMPPKQRQPQPGPEFTSART